MRAGTKIGVTCAWVVLVLCLLFVGRVTDAQPVAQQASVNESVTTRCESSFLLCNPYDDDLQAKREANRWAIPSAGITLQGVAGRVLTTDVVQRVLRLYGLLQHAPLDVLSFLCDGAEHIVLSKRFHTGYYIYHRCQMRC